MPRAHRQGLPHIAVSLFDGLADWMAVPLIHREYTGREPKRIGLNHPTIAPYGAYAAGDGAQFIISIQTEPEWASLCRDVLDRPDMVDDPRFSTNSRRARQSRRTRRRNGRGAVALRCDAEWRRRCVAPTSRSGATTRSANSRGIRNCAASRSARRAGRSASPRRRRYSMANPSRSGPCPPSASTAKRSGANLPRIEERVGE